MGTAMNFRPAGRAGLCPVGFFRSFPMEKQAQNIQESFLNNARKDKTFLTIYLMSGVKLSGKIKSFDKYSVVLETNNQEQLIFKHAISTVVVSRPFHRRSAFERRGRLARRSRNSGRTGQLASREAGICPRKSRSWSA